MSYRRKPKPLPPPEYLSDPQVIALQTALRDRNPFYSGVCSIPDYQRVLYYTHDNVLRRIDFPNPGMDDLAALYHACKPAEFGRNGENVLDESYRKAGKMDLVSFATLLDPRRLGIHEQVSKALLTQGYPTMDAELYKLNVYGQGDFFKAHKDTPRGRDMFGSLVIVLPTHHEGGQFVLRQGEKEWTLDFTDKFAAAAEPSACFVAFYGDIEHEVLPVMSGYRVTLTYNLYHKPVHQITSSIPTPFHFQLKRALADLVNNKTNLPNGGYLGFGLVHEYIHTGDNLLEQLSDQLKGTDRAFADVCDELGLRYSLRLFYRNISRVDLITTKALDVKAKYSQGYYERDFHKYFHEALEGLTIEEAECVALVGGREFDPWPLADHYYHKDGEKFTYFRNPVTEVMEITRMKSSVEKKVSFMAYGNEAELCHFYGTACMLIAVAPAESRDLVGVKSEDPTAN